MSAAPVEPEHVAPERFRTAMSRLPTFVTVITTYGPDGPIGCTANSVMSLSLATPSVAFSLSTRSRTGQWIARGETPFAINALTWSQRSLVSGFATGDPAQRFDGVLHEHRAGCPVLAEAMPVLVCVLEDSWTVHDHVLFVGRVVHTSGDESQVPLVHHRREPHTLEHRKAPDESLVGP